MALRCLQLTKSDEKYESVLMTSLHDAATNRMSILKKGTHAPQEAAANVTPDHLGRPSHLTRMDEFLFDAVYFFVQYATAIVVICLSISEHSTVSGKVVSQ